MDKQMHNMKGPSLEYPSYYLQNNVTNDQKINLLQQSFCTHCLDFQV